MIALYVFFKFCIYCALCFGLVRLFRLQLDSSWNFSIAWGAARLLMGFLFGVLIAYSFALLRSSGAPELVSYMLAFLPFRAVEWALLFGFIARKHSLSWGPRAYAWVGGSVAASVLADGMAILLGLDELKFVC